MVGQKKPSQTKQQDGVSHLGGQEPCQVDLRDHLAAAVALLLVAVLVVLDQVPDLDPALEVRGDHGGARTQAVGASSVLDHVLCEKEEIKGIWAFQEHSVFSPLFRTSSHNVCFGVQPESKELVCRQ